MNGVSGNRLRAFDGFQAGSVFAAALIAVGIEALVRTLSWPLAAVVAEIINYIVRTGRFGIVTISPPSLPLLLILAGGITGILLLLCGLRLAAWLGQGAGD